MKHITPYPTNLHEGWHGWDPPDSPDLPDPVRDAKELTKAEKLFHLLGIGRDFALFHKGPNPKDLWFCDVTDLEDIMKDNGYWYYYPGGDDWDDDPWTHSWSENEDCLEDFLTDIWLGKVKGVSRSKFFTTAEDGQNLMRYLWTIDEMPEPEEDEDEVDDLVQDRRCFQVDSQEFAEYLLDSMTRSLSQSSQRRAQVKGIPSYKTLVDRNPQEDELEVRRLILILSRVFPPR
jgi:hypothetical protein